MEKRRRRIRVTVGITIALLVALLAPSAMANRYLCCQVYCGSNRWAQCCYLDICSSHDCDTSESGCRSECNGDSLSVNCSGGSD